MSNTPVSVDLPHRLGAAEARRRIDGRLGDLAHHLPGGAEVRSAWEGDRLALRVALLGQEVSAGIDVRETFVRVEVLLPPALAVFGRAIEAGLRRGGGALLEDRSGADAGPAA